MLSVAMSPTKVSRTMAHHEADAHRRARDETSPSVFVATYSAPCDVSVANAITPVSTVYQSKMPGCSVTVNVVQSGSKKYPSAFSGTPRITFPNAAPKNIANSKLEIEKTTSKKFLQRTASTRDLNSIPIARSITSHRT